MTKIVKYTYSFTCDGDQCYAHVEFDDTEELTETELVYRLDKAGWVARQHFDGESHYCRSCRPMTNDGDER